MSYLRSNRDDNDRFRGGHYVRTWQIEQGGKSQIKSKSVWREENEVNTAVDVWRVCISGLEGCAHKVYTHSMQGVSTGHCTRTPSSSTLLRGSENTISTEKHDSAINVGYL